MNDKTRKQFVQQASQKSKEEAWKEIQEKRSHMEEQLQHLTITSELEGGKVTCDGNQENYQVDIPGLSMSQITLLESLLNAHTKKIQAASTEINLQIHNASWGKL